MLNFQKKEKIICKMNGIAKTALSAVVATLTKVTVNEINKLRKEARDINVYIYVVRNTLMRRIIKRTHLECLQDLLVGQNIIAFSMKRPRDSACIFEKFVKNNENFKIKGAAFDGKFIPASKISILSNLPDQNEAISRLIAVLKTSSIGNLIQIFYVLSNQKK